ncbi:MAG: hypothetical protein H6710_03115 [Myxococcales bacterium]|nr:hypothetical protein [Myxococcales bacterium]
MSEPPELALRDPGADPAEIRERAAALGASPAAVSLLMGRGVRTPEDQERWLRSRLADLRPPDAMAGFEPALDLLQTAIRRNWRVGVFGDYDVDGVTTATILTTYLEALGVQVVPRSPAAPPATAFGSTTRARWSRPASSSSSPATAGPPITRRSSGCAPAGSRAR